MSNSIQFVALLLALSAALVSAFQYQVIVQTGSSFAPTVGSLNVSISNATFRSNEFAVINKQKIEQNSLYARSIDLPLNVQQIVSANVSFVVNAPWSSSSRKISVVKVSVVPTYIQNAEFRRMETVNLTSNAPQVLLAHKQNFTFIKN